MTKEASKEKLEAMQQSYMHLQMLDQQMKQVQENLAQLDKQKIDLLQVQQSLDDLKKAGINSETLVPLSAGIFVKAELKNNNTMLVNVGGNITVEKTVEETKEMVSQQLQELKNLEKEMEIQLRKFAEEAILIETKINSQK